MRKVTFLLLVALSSSALAEWVSIGKTDEVITYADPGTIRRAGDMAKMWHLYDYKAAVVIVGVKPYLSTRVQNEYDCKEERVRMLASSAHSKNMAQGDVISVNTDPRAWMPVPPGTMIEILWEFACAKN